MRKYGAKQRQMGFHGSPAVIVWFLHTDDGHSCFGSRECNSVICSAVWHFIFDLKSVDIFSADIDLRMPNAHFTP